MTTTQTPARKPLRKRWSVRIPVIAGAGLIALVACGSAGSHPAATASPTTAPPSTSAPASPAAQPTTAAPAPSKPAKPTISVSRQQALSSAQGYLSDGQGFSRAGLIKQLTSPYGSQFSTADATWAVDHAGADWDAQALTAAKGYMSDGQGFSRAGLIQQLTSPYGGDFTLAQATYAVNHVGL